MKRHPVLIAWLFALLLSLNGCAWILGLPQIESKDVAGIVDKLGEDNASACFWIGGRGGGGSLAITPIPTVPVGGMGSGEVLVGRVNSDNTKLTIGNGSCSIERGGN